MKEDNAVKDVAILSELDRKFAEMAALLPQTEVTALEHRVAELKVEGDEDYQTATDLGVKVASWVSKVEGFWEAWREHYFRRYKAVMAVTQNGITTADAEGNPIHSITGTAQLAKIRQSIEHLMRDYKIRHKRETAERQSSLNQMVERSKAEVEDERQNLLLQGDFEGARRLKYQAESIHPVAIMRQEVKSQGATIREPYNWTLDENDGLMRVIKAIAAGDVPLMHDVTVKGKSERRALVELSSVVLNHKTRELGPELSIPGITISKDVNFAFRRTGTQ